MVYIVLNCTILNQANAKLLSSAFPQLVFSQREGKHLAKREKRKRQQCWCCFCYYQIPRYRGVASTQNRLQEKSIFFMYKSAEDGNDFKEKGSEKGIWFLDNLSLAPPMLGINCFHSVCIHLGAPPLGEIKSLRGCGAGQKCTPQQFSLVNDALFV